MDDACTIAPRKAAPKPARQFRPDTMSVSVPTDIKDGQGSRIRVRITLPRLSILDGWEGS